MGKSQEEFVKETLRLKQENPEMEIRFCVDSDELLDGFSWTAHRIAKVKVNPWYSTGETIYTDESEIQDELADLLFVDGVTDEELDKAVDAAYEKEVKDVICVYTCAG